MVAGQCSNRHQPAIFFIAEGAGSGTDQPYRSYHESGARLDRFSGRLLPGNEDEWRADRWLPADFLCTFAAAFTVALIASHG